MTVLKYNNKRLIPAPFVSISKSYSTTGDGEKIGSQYDITLIGKIVAYKGSPDSIGTFWEAAGYPSDETITDANKLTAIQVKQQAIRELFSDDGKQLYIQALGGGIPVTCAPRVISVDFPDGLWYDQCDYTITLQSDILGSGEPPGYEESFSEYISDAQETWSINKNEDQWESIDNNTYTITHDVSAVGKRAYDYTTGSLLVEAWQQARSWVQSRLGFDEIIALSSGVLNLPSYYHGYNHVLTENIGKKDGSYSVQETWIVASGNALDDFNVQVVDSLDNPYTTVSIEGTVTGLEASGTPTGSTSKWVNASGRFELVDGLALARAQQYSNLTLNITPRSKTVARNPYQGFITYTYEYDNRPRALVSGVKSEVIAVGDTFGGESFASIFVLGRAAGPVLQDLNTKSANVRSLNIELVVDPPTVSTYDQAGLQTYFFQNNPRASVLYSGDIQTIIDAVNPANNGFSSVFSSQPQENWNPREGRFTYTQEWTYE